MTESGDVEELDEGVARRHVKDLDWPILSALGNVEAGEREAGVEDRAEAVLAYGDAAFSNLGMN